MFGNIGWGEIVLIMLVILLLFGAKRIPEVMRSLGKGVREFKGAMREVTTEIENEPNSITETKKESVDKKA